MQEIKFPIPKPMPLMSVKWTDAAAVDQIFGAETLFDLELSDDFTDEKGDKVANPGLSYWGVIYPTESPVGFNGAYYYVRLEGNF